MPDLSSYDYALLRVMPYEARGEFVNVGVILFCRTRNYLAARFEVDEARLRLLAPELDLDMLRRYLALIPDICAGRGPIGELGQAESFHWLVSPHNTVIQTSPVHSGLCRSPEEALEQIMNAAVRRAF